MKKLLIKNLPLLFFAFILVSFVEDRIMNSHLDIIEESTDSTSVIADGATLQLISNRFSFTEGPAPDKHGNVFFTDQPNDRIWRYGTDGQLSIFLEKTGRSNGLYFDKKGNLLACADERNELWSISPNKEVTVLVKDFDGEKLNGPNDLWVDKKGGIYFTDPYYQRPYWTRTKAGILEQRVYYLPKKGRLRIAAENFKQPNGIIGTPDGKFLYVADIGDNKTYRFRIQAGGKLTDQQLFAPQGSDGMTIDNKGNIYLTGDGVAVYSREGKRIQHIAVPAKWTANVCFGGIEKNKLFITASENLYVLNMKVKGVQ
jgi:gluconolactonase